MDFLPHGSFTNSGSLAGGNCGDGGVGGGHGGNGGDGVVFALSVGGFPIGSFTNSGTVTGGNGGNAGPGAPGIGGDGGIGVFGADFLTDSGKISGGLASDGVTRADAIDLVRSLTLLAGYQIIGNVVGGPHGESTNNLIVLGGDANSQFDVSQIGSQYQNFGLFEKTGSSTWTLENTTTALTPWKIFDGILQVSSDGALGSSTGYSKTARSPSTVSAPSSFYRHSLPSVKSS